jgi:hypothetical protein
VKDLAACLEKMSGAKPEVVPSADPAAAKAPAIVLGEAAVKLGAAPAKTAHGEAFRLLVKDGRVLIGGESDQAVAHGIYELLERLGCAWLLPGPLGEVVPSKKTVTVPEMDVAGAPDFALRELWYRGGSKLNTPEDFAHFSDWKRRNRLGTGLEVPGLGGGHVWDAFIKRHKEEFDRDPTMLALVRAKDGTMQRKGPQLESTHPRVVELFAEEIKEAFAKNQWPKDKLVSFGIGPADGLGYSQSPESILAGSGRVDPLNGERDVTDLLVLLGNQVLAKVEKEHPNVHLGFYSYSSHADYPARYVPHKNLNVIFAPINASRFHGIDDAASKTKPYYKKVVLQWAELARKQGNLLSYRGYNWNLAENMVPFSQVLVLAQEIPFYKQCGFLGCSVEATKAWSVNGPHDWVYAKLLWNAATDVKAALADYCRKAFGPAAPPMERYLTRLAENQRDAGQEAGSYHALHLIFAPKFVQEAEGYLKEAQRLAATPAERERVGHFVHGLDAAKLYLDYHAATLRFDFAAARKGYDAMIAHWEKAYAKDTSLVAKEVPQYLKRFLLRFLDEGVKYSAAPYRVVAKLPDELATQFDSSGMGEAMGFAKPELNDRDWLRTRTISTTWDAQGLAAYRQGAVWYRFRFRLPEDARGKPLGLFLGSVDDTARAWLNGKPAGEATGFSVPMTFDLTDAAKADGENVLVVQVSRKSLATELGTGGILRPSFLFTGPRLEPKAAPGKEERVLPGGEVAPGG